MAPARSLGAGPRRARGRLAARAGLLLLVLVLLVAAFALRSFWLAGELRSLTPHFAGECRLVPGVPGPEDLTIHPRTGVAYLSSSDRRALAAGRPRPGALYAYDLFDPAATPVRLTGGSDITFQPHGLSLLAGEGGRDVLFVINHPPLGVGRFAHTVEVFDLVGGRLVHRQTLADERLVMPNDLVAVGPDRFYLTNTHANPPGLAQTLETWLLRPGATVLRHADGRFETALDGLVLPNGIQVSRDGRTLYLASSTGRSLRIYDRDPADESLALRAEVPLGSGPDNLEVDAEGRVWIGSHPKLITLQRHAADPARRAPSQVLRVDPDGKVEEVLLSEGDPLSGASVAAFFEGRLLVGQIWGDGFLDCHLAGP
jgi:arylesterase/paraoxonase